MVSFHWFFLERGEEALVREYEQTLERECLISINKYALTRTS